MSQPEKTIISCNSCIHKITCSPKRYLDNTIENFETFDFITFTKFDLHQMLAQSCSEFQSLVSHSIKNEFISQSEEEAILKESNSSEDVEKNDFSNLNISEIDSELGENLRKLYEEKKFSEVIQKLELLLKEHPKNINILVPLATTLDQLENIDAKYLQIIADRILEIEHKF